jgi:hypothetical protein
VTPTVKTPKGRSTLTGLRALVTSGVEDFTLQLLAGVMIVAGEWKVSLEEVVADLVQRRASPGSVVPVGDTSSLEDEDSVGDVSESQFLRLFSGRSTEPLIAMRAAQNRAVERIRDYRKKKLKSEEPVVTVRVLLSSTNKQGANSLSPPPPPPREPRPDVLAPRRSMRN